MGFGGFLSYFCWGMFATGLFGFWGVPFLSSDKKGTERNSRKEPFCERVPYVSSQRGKGFSRF
jgi:hypothetical protein